MRTGEVFALRWQSVDLAARPILVRESTKGPVKDREPRAVPIVDPLLPVLQEWRLRHPGAGVVIPPLRMDGRKIDKGTPGPVLREALAGLALARNGLGWYEATRHTFASHWAMSGGPMPELQRIMGHSSLETTMPYAHLAPGFFSPGARSLFDVDLSRPAAT